MLYFIDLFKDSQKITKIKLTPEFSSLDTKIRFINWDGDQLINPSFGRSLSLAQKLWDPPGDTGCETDRAVPQALWSH